MSRDLYDSLLELVPDLEDAPGIRHVDTYGTAALGVESLRVLVDFLTPCAWCRAVAGQDHEDTCEHHEDDRAPRTFTVVSGNALLVSALTDDEACAKYEAHMGGNPCPCGNAVCMCVGDECVLTVAL